MDVLTKHCWQQQRSLPAPYPHDSYCNHDEQGPVSLTVYSLPYKT